MVITTRGSLSSVVSTTSLGLKPKNPSIHLGQEVEIGFGVPPQKQVRGHRQWSPHRHPTLTFPHIRSPIFSAGCSPGMGGLEYPSPYATAGRKRRPKGAMAKVPYTAVLKYLQHQRTTRDTLADLKRANLLKGTRKQNL